MHVPFSYLKEKFSEYRTKTIFDRMWHDVIKSGDFTLGKVVHEFESKFAKLIGATYAVGVANGTDALELSLLACGIKPGDEVICPANTFIASLGAVANVGAKPVLVDVDSRNVMDVSKIHSKLTDKTRGILPVHFCGTACDMKTINAMADHYNLSVIEDACQAYLCKDSDENYVGTTGDCGAFSLHPLKILNVMGDGGMITTNDKDIYEDLKLRQNHGLKDRDTIVKFPCRNSRLDSLHAVVGLQQISGVKSDVSKRQYNAKRYLEGLRDEVKILDHAVDNSVYHLFMIQCKTKPERELLYQHLIDKGVEAKIHYPIPLYQQDGLWTLKHKKGDFPMADHLCDTVITLPVHEHLTHGHITYTINTIREFYVELRKNRVS